VKRKLRLGLRTQLIIAMVICVIGTVLVSTVTSIVASDAIMAGYEEGLSPAARKLNDTIERFRIPTDFSAAPELIRKGQKLDQESENIGLWVGIGISAASALIGILIALFLATKIGRPLEAVSAAARRVADGDLTARIDIKVGGAGETNKLIHNFNTMARALERYDRQSSESTAAVAHELRTPLAILRGRLQGMREGLFKTEGSDIDGLIQQVESLTQIVNDLNTVSLAQAARLDIETAPVDVADVIETLARAVEPDLHAAGLSLETALSSVTAQADENRLRQATLALINNARSHGGTGGVVRLETGGDQDGPYIRVLDRGPGLPDGDADRLFDPFWRSDASRSRASGGSGLGLSVVASIVRAHGGSVHANPRIGGGAVFEIRLPAFNV
jgi:two-component system, OmpR family, sensor histidine kinase AdeS